MARYLDASEFQSQLMSAMLAAGHRLPSVPMVAKARDAA